jgi:hypothetical protein
VGRELTVDKTLLEDLEKKDRLMVAAKAKLFEIFLGPFASEDIGMAGASVINCLPTGGS